MRYFSAPLAFFFFTAALTSSVSAQTSPSTQTPTQTETPASAQTSPPTQTSPPAQTSTVTDPQDSVVSIVGTVVSISSQTMVVRTDDNQFHLFSFDKYTVRPKQLAPNTRVRIISSPTDEPGLRLANRVTVQDAANTTGSGAQQEMAPPPKEMVDLQNEIERVARRWQFGVRIGAGLDPELFMFGVHSSIGPIFSRNLHFRPNAEFAFGELTDMVALNLEMAYRLPITFQQGRWSAYVGAGPGLNFVHQGVGTRDISFGNFDYETSFNIFTGVRVRKGAFVEVKTALWAPSVPTLRMIFGYTF